MSRMPNITSILKEEIAQLARNNLCSDSSRYGTASTHDRSELVVLKQRMATLEQEVGRLASMGRGKVEASKVRQPDGRTRFTASGLRA